MADYVAENAEKTRRAVVCGRRVTFYRRKRVKGQYRSPEPVWPCTYRDHRQACEAADLWAQQGKLIQPRASGAASRAKRARQMEMTL